MKKTYIALWAIVGLSSSLHAVSLTLSNNNFAVGFTDNSGVPLAAGSGVIVGGIFNDPAAISLETLGTNFVSLVNPVVDGSSSLNVNAPSAQDGVISGTLQGGRQAADSSFVGANIFVIVGNGSTLADSTEFAILDTGSQFDADLTTVTESTITFTPSGGSIVPGFGESTPGGLSLFGGVISAEQISLTAIPEPSSALLAGLALVGGLVRRRR